MLALSIIILDIIQRTFSPPDNTLQVFNASPEKIILPRKLRILTSSRSSSVFTHDASLQVINHFQNKNGYLLANRLGWLHPNQNT
jgi:hypothetical protein